MKKKGVLLLNLGTPDACTPKAIRRYLREFLSDPRVIDLPWLARHLLVYGIVIPFRTQKTTEAYRKIWGKEGSPLLVHNLRLTETLAKDLGESYQVALGMRYGSPSIPEALEELRKCSSIIVLPLFPQYSSAATGSALEKTCRHIAKQWNFPSLSIKNCFYADPLYIKAYADKIQSIVRDKKIDLLLFSYHGLPERHLRKSGCQKICDTQDACLELIDVKVNCYRAQCYKTSILIAQTLGLNSTQYAVAFQSRLGSTPWIKPYTDQLLEELCQKGIKNIAVASPSFVTDCLETLEEIDIRLREQWSSLGGEEFTFVPCLNADPECVAMLKHWVLDDIKN